MVTPLLQARAGPCSVSYLQALIMDLSLCLPWLQRGQDWCSKIPCSIAPVGSCCCYFPLLLQTSPLPCSQGLNFGLMYLECSCPELKGWCCSWVTRVMLLMSHCPQVTAESHLARVLPLLRYSDSFHTVMPPWVLKFAFHGPLAGLNSVAAKLAECNTEGQLQSLLGCRRRFPGFQQVIDPA